MKLDESCKQYRHVVTVSATMRFNIWLICLFMFVYPLYLLNSCQLFCQSFIIINNTLERQRRRHVFVLSRRSNLFGSSTEDNGCCDTNNNDSTSAASQENGIQTTVKQKKRPTLVKPCFEAADPNYSNIGPIGQGTFIISRDGEPLLSELDNINILKIVANDINDENQCTDLEINTLVWKCLGYRYNTIEQKWNDNLCFPKWKEKYPIISTIPSEATTTTTITTTSTITTTESSTSSSTASSSSQTVPVSTIVPPDFIGMQRIYSPSIDKVCLKANQALVKSIPVEYKQTLKEQLKQYGWTGYQYSELTPNKTRRAQCANWLLYYRTELFGYTIDQLRTKRLQKQQQQQQQDSSDKDENTTWKVPVREVF